MTRSLLPLLVCLATMSCASTEPYLLDRLVPQRPSRVWQAEVLQRAGEVGYATYRDAAAVDRMAELGVRTPAGADTTGWIVAVKERGCGFLNFGCQQYDLLVVVDALDPGPGEDRVQIIVYGIKKPLLGGHSVTAPSAAARLEADALLRLIRNREVSLLGRVGGVRRH